MSLTNGPLVTKKWLMDSIDGWRSQDDVFRDDFLGGIAFTGVDRKEDLKIDPNAQNLLASLGICWTDVFSPKYREAVPLPGPYFVSSRQLLEIRRLYDDTHGAFVTSFIASSYL